MDRGAWGATVHGVAELDTTEQLSTAQHRPKDQYSMALSTDQLPLPAFVNKVLLAHSHTHLCMYCLWLLYPLELSRFDRGREGSEA